MNKIQTEWVLCQTDQTLGEAKAFRLMVEALGPEEKSSLLRSKELQSLVAFEPQVMNHDTLRHHRYRPEALDPALVKKATEEHHKLVIAYREIETAGNPDTESRVLKRTAELLYIVRSNIAHGEKTQYGPDLAKRQRDENVCAVIVPLQLICIDYLLHCPSRKLVAYGTLAPGKENHRVIEDIAGAWESCTLHGSVKVRDGLPAFSWNPAGPQFAAQLFVSEHLPARWPQIDEFEGAAYKRRLITVGTVGGVAVASTYLSTKH